MEKNEIFLAISRRIMKIHRNTRKCGFAECICKWDVDRALQMYG